MNVNELNRLSTSLLSKKEKDFITVHFINKNIVSMINDYCHGDLLDIGCGNKPYETLFKTKANNYVGCDIVQSSLNKVDVICDALSLPFGDSKFDTAFSTQVIEHVNNPSKMIKEIYRVLKPGGSLIMTGPFVWELHEEPHDYFRFTKYGFTKLLKDFNFEVVLIVPCGGKWAAFFQLFLNMIYTSFGGGFLSKIGKFIFIHLKFTYIFNTLALWIEKKYFDDVLTLNYAIVAIKPFDK